MLDPNRRWRFCGESVLDDVEAPRDRAVDYSPPPNTRVRNRSIPRDMRSPEQETYLTPEYTQENNAAAIELLRWWHELLEEQQQVQQQETVHLRTDLADVQQGRQRHSFVQRPASLFARGSRLHGTPT